LYLKERLLRTAYDNYYDFLKKYLCILLIIKKQQCNIVAESYKIDTAAVTAAYEYNRALLIREEIMELTSIVKKRYIRRAHEQGLEMNPDNQFTDISYVLEQLIDYCDMIADALIRYYIEIGEDEQADAGTDESIRKNIHMLFADKYEALGIE
jgi:hypothetical protein